jgi:hypothetical protein
LEVKKLNPKEAFITSFNCPAIFMRIEKKLELLKEGYMVEKPYMSEEERGQAYEALENINKEISDLFSEVFSKRT